MFEIGGPCDLLVIEFLLTASKKKPATSGLWIRSPSVRIRCEASLWLRSTRKSNQPSLRPTDIQKICLLLRMTRSFQAAAECNCPLSRNSSEEAWTFRASRFHLPGRSDRQKQSNRELKS